MMWEAWRGERWMRAMVPLLLVLVQAEDSLARSVATMGPQKDAALELTGENFNSSLWAAPATSAIVEFYAHWCPACRNFKPHYERVAELFNGRDAPYPGVVLMAKVDCAEQRYPTMLWGKPATFAWGNLLSEKDDLEQINSGFNAQHLLDWVNAKLARSYVLDAAKEKQLLAELTGSITEQVASIQDIEEATAQSFDIILDNELVSSDHRAPFVHFLQLLAVHHPSRRCRAGSAQILFNLMDAWPAEHVLEAEKYVSGREDQKSAVVAHVKALRQFHVCREDLPRKTYKTCNMVTGGYSCGLWYLFHALSVRVDDLESRAAMTTIIEFVKNFFICEECQEHFLKMSESAIENISSRRALALWLWRAHNEVNRRLAKKAAELQSEIPVPTLQWPPEQMCASCRIVSEKMHGSADEEVKWDEDVVYQFLRKIYGPSLEAVTTDAQTGGTGQLDEAGIGVEDSMTSSAMTVPVGAALGIAMASCGFGIVACCWRVQQKKRNSGQRPF